MRRSLAFLPLVALVGCTVQLREGRSPTTASAPAAAAAPAPAAPAAPAAPQTVTPATPGVVAAPPGAPQPIGKPGIGPKLTAPVVAGATPTGPLKAFPGPGFKPAPVIAKPNSFGGSSPGANTIMGQVFAIPAGTSALPDFTKLSPFATIHTAAWDISPRKFDQGFPGVSGDRVEWFAIRWEGTVRVTSAGLHAFRILSDDGARLFIDGQRVVDNDGVHPPKEASGTANLTAGAHTLVIEYFQGPKYEIALQVHVTPPGSPMKLLGSSI